MTVSTTTNKVVAQGNGLTTTFSFSFPVPAASDLKVYYTDTFGNISLLSPSTYTVAGVGSPNGGSVTYPLSGSPITSGTSLTIQRVVPYQQLTDLVNQSGYYPDVVEGSLDNLEMQIQQVAQLTTNALVFPIYETPINPVIPALGVRLNKILGFDSNGSPTAIPLPASIGAGNLTSEGPFSSGTNFNPGVTTTLTLSQSYVNPANVQVHFDGVYQGTDQYTLSGNQIIFTSPIPVGVSKVYIVGGTTLSVFTPAANSVNDACIASGTALYNRIHNVINVMDPAYGAKLDGVHDDTNAFIAAIAAAASLGGGVVFVPAGTPLISSPVLIGNDNITIRGDSQFTTTVKVPSNAAGFIGYNPSAVFVVNGNNSGVSRMGLDGNIANNSAQAFCGISTTAAVSGFFVEDCYIRNFIYEGIATSPASGAVTNFSIRRNRIENIGWEAIAARCTQNGVIEGNHIISCGSNGIVTGYSSTISNFTVSANVQILNNFVMRATPPTYIINGNLETGFMIVIGAGDSEMTVDGNLCYDNRNAGQDGIGLGQDGVRLNQAIVFSNNIVVYAGLYGIDATSNHVVSNNYIRLAAQQGIKLGTDIGGNLANCTVIGNIVDTCNQNVGAGTQDGIWVDGTLTVPDPTAVYENIKITGNRVIDYGSPQRTAYGLNITFKNNLTYQNCEFSGNDFSGVSTAGVRATGIGLPQQTGWSYVNNRHPTQVPQVSGAILTVFGYDKVQVVQGGATTVTNILGGFDGCDLSVQHNDGNTTWKFNSNALMYGNNNTNLTPSAGNWTKFERFNGVWGGYQTVH